MLVERNQCGERCIRGCVRQADYMETLAVSQGFEKVRAAFVDQRLCSFIGIDDLELNLGIQKHRCCRHHHRPRLFLGLPEHFGVDRLEGRRYREIGGPSAGECVLPALGTACRDVLLPSNRARIRNSDAAIPKRGRGRRACRGSHSQRMSATWTFPVPSVSSHA